MAKKDLLKLLLQSVAEEEHSNVLTSTYDTSDSGKDITISLWFGPAGIMTSTEMVLDNKPFLPAQAGDVDALVIGKDAALDGSTLLCVSKLTATAESNAPVDLELTCTISGGIQDYTHSLTMPADEVGDQVTFAIKINFSIS